MGNQSSKPALVQLIEILTSDPLPSGKKRLSRGVWKISFRSPQNVDDVAAWLPLDSMRFMRTVLPRNFATLIVKIVEELEDILQEAREEPVNDGDSEQDAEKLPRIGERNKGLALACVRLLTRCLPVLLESSLENDPATHEWVQALLWKGEWPPIYRQGPVDSGSKEGAELATVDESTEPREAAQETSNGLRRPSSPTLRPLGQITAYAEMPEPSNEIALNATAAPEDAQIPTLRPLETTEDAFRSEAAGEEDPSSADEQQTEEAVADLGHRIMAVLLELLFCRNFTLSEQATSTIWAAGPGATVGQKSSSPAVESARVEVLRALLAFCSEPLYISLALYSSTDKPFLRAMTRREGLHRRAPDLFYSVLNTVMFQVSGGSLLKAKDMGPSLLDTCIHVILMLLDFNPALPQELGGGVEKEGADVAYLESNMFQQLMASIDETRDFEFLMAGLVHLFRSAAQGGSRVRLLRARPHTDSFPELLVLLWKFLLGNPAFADYVAGHHDATKLLEPILGLVFRERQDAARVGVMHVACFCLLVLSSRRQFAVQLNKKASQVAYPDVRLNLSDGSHADFLIHVIYKIVFNAGDRAPPLYSCLLTVLANVSPFIKSTSMRSADHLMTLLAHFAAPRMLFASPTNYIFVRFILESINNVLHYQGDGNMNLVYCMVRKADLFYALRGLQLPSPTLELVPASPSPAHLPLLAEEVTPGARSSMARAQEGDSGVEVTLDGVDSAGVEEAEEPTGNDIHLVDRNRPWMTAQWLAKVQKELPLVTAERVIRALMPQVDALYHSTQLVSERQLLEVLRNTTLVGLLPPAPQIMVRKYQANVYTDLWFTSYLHGVVFQRQNDNCPISLADGNLVRLFKVTYLDTVST